MPSGSAPRRSGGLVWLVATVFVLLVVVAGVIVPRLRRAAVAERAGASGEQPGGPPPMSMAGTPGSSAGVLSDGVLDHRRVYVVVRAGEGLALMDPAEPSTLVFGIPGDAQDLVIRPEDGRLVYWRRRWVYRGRIQSEEQHFAHVFQPDLVVREPSAAGWKAPKDPERNDPPLIGTEQCKNRITTLYGDPATGRVVMRCAYPLAGSYVDDHGVTFESVGNAIIRFGSDGTRLAAGPYGDRVVLRGSEPPRPVRGIGCDLPGPLRAAPAGFWLVGWVTAKQHNERWTVASDGTSSHDGVFAPPPPWIDGHLWGGGCLDGVGTLYQLGTNMEAETIALIRRPLVPGTAEVVLDEKDLRQAAGRASTATSIPSLESARLVTGQ